jgi:hypothetical protein
MDVSTVTTIVSTLGFPIAMCCILMWYLNKQEERHTAEITKLSEAVENNTVAMNSLVAKLAKD